jgi:hypothetical protein
MTINSTALYVIPPYVALELCGTIVNRLPLAYKKEETVPWPRVEMDSDVWKSELSVFVSAKNVIMDISICIRF